MILSSALWCVVVFMTDFTAMFFVRSAASTATYPWEMSLFSQDEFVWIVQEVSLGVGPEWPGLPVLSFIWPLPARILVESAVSLEGRLCPLGFCSVSLWHLGVTAWLCGPDHCTPFPGLTAPRGPGGHGSSVPFRCLVRPTSSWQVLLNSLLSFQPSTIFLSSLLDIVLVQSE